jgi:phosphoglycerate dehydrogenase-like enzyme
MAKIVVTTAAFSKNEVLVREIRSFFPDSLFNFEGKKFNTYELIEFLKDADGAIVGLDQINDEVLSQCPNLKIVSKFGVGLDNININDCKKHNVSIGWTGGVNRTSVAEMTLGFMLMFSRNLYITSNQLKADLWNKSGGFQLSGKTIGIIGVGYIGKEVIRLLKPFGCTILVNDIIDQKEYYADNGLIEATKEEIYKQSDIVTIHTPLTATTNNMITLEIIEQMKPTAYLLNTARGGIINENDLKYALQKGIIAGAGIDAYSEEPPTDKEFLALPNLICTPHIGGNAKEAVEAMGMSAIEHLKKKFNKDNEL